ncbi:uncharacterized protein ATNIH1004_001777 [Aspergillus tanneri]|uniref:Uncharacterized protein n=1 Tax=Aspergillus tanneri TaxID=1220188 RepID=A0A5M9N1A3_9EURO|nr:uncharacterized protein ATNIH1004_001777 [Aspergillus tanneri]KAA8652868.1 hypothetical protein ATNIH1004_001777 [Aspergillus tanneri]
MQRDFLGLMAKKMFQDRSSPVPNPGCDMGGTAVGLLIYLLRGHLFHACRIELPHWTGLGDPDARLEGDYMLDWVEKVAREDITYVYSTVHQLVRNDFGSSIRGKGLSYMYEQKESQALRAV